MIKVDRGTFYEAVKGCKVDNPLPGLYEYRRGADLAGLYVESGRAKVEARLYGGAARFYLARLPGPTAGNNP